MNELDECRFCGTHIFSNIIVSEVLGYEVRAIPGLQEACQGSRHVFTTDLVFQRLNLRPRKQCAAYLLRSW